MGKFQNNHIGTIDTMKKTILTRIIIVLFSALPLETRKRFYRFLFLLFYHLSGKHRLIVLHNLSLSFPEKRLSEIIRIAKNACMNLGTILAEFFEIPALVDRDEIRSLVAVEGREHFTRALEKGKGILFFTAHMGNWEVMSVYFGRYLGKAHIIYRTLDNPVLDNLVALERSYTGHNLISKGGAKQKIMQVLKDNGIIGILLDQNVSWYEGAFVDFFNRPACTTTRFAALALETGAPVLPAHIVRLDDGTYRFTIEEEVELIRSGNYEQDLFDNTQKFTAIIEGWVRSHPDQWFWLHQRWKTKRVQMKGERSR